MHQHYLLSNVTEFVFVYVCACVLFVCLIACVCV